MNSFKSEDNNLEREILAGNAIAMQMQQEAEKAAAETEVRMETEVIQQQPTPSNVEITDNTTTEEDVKNFKLQNQEVKNVTNAHIGPIWYHSEPSDFAVSYTKTALTNGHF